MKSNESIIRQNPIVLALQMFVLTLIFNFVYLIISLVADAFETFDQETFVSLVKYDSASYILLMILQFFLLLWLTLRWYHNVYYVEDNFLVNKSGILFKSERRLVLNSFESIIVHQGFFGKIFQYGTIQISQSSQGQRISLYAVSKPHEFVHWLRNLPKSEKK